jgi:tRNA pseudouridine38-40 synthase
VPAFRLTIAYDGTDFVGWQRQPAGVSIQGLLEDAIAPLEDRRVVVTGAGRTDAGVHAEGQVAGIRLERDIDPATLVRAINARLPPTVRVLDAAIVPDAFHPRFDALAKTYRYRLFTGPVMSPFAVRYAWHVPGALHVDAMHEAAQMLLGEHDFSAFQSVGTDHESAVRVLYRSDLTREACPAREVRPEREASAERLTYTVRGNGFLRHMVRALVGTLVEVGRRRHPADWVREVLESRDRGLAGPTAPPEGLCLVGVEYPPLAARP